MVNQVYQKLIKCFTALTYKRLHKTFKNHFYHAVYRWKAWAKRMFCPLFS
jgi:hypothetical protein